MTKTKHFDFLLSIRKSLLIYLDNLTPGQLGYIPVDFSNGIFRNIVYRIVVRQFLRYQLSGNKLLTNDGLLKKYNRGTSPQKITPLKEEIYQVEGLLLNTISRLQGDYQTGLFDEFPTVKVGLFYIDTIKDAMRINSIHESRHLGTMLALSYSSSRNQYNMAYSITLANRVHEYSVEIPRTTVGEKTVFGGLAFSVGDKMCTNIGENTLICRFNPEQAEEIAKRQGFSPVVIRGKELSDYYYVDPTRYNQRRGLDFQLQLCLEFNNKAKSPKKKNKND